jgi:hypothetical protein
MTELTTHELWVEARQMSVTVVRTAPTTLRVDWTLPTGTKVWNGQVVLLSETQFDASYFPTDGVRYTASTDFAAPADQIHQAHVISALYGAFNDDLTIISAVITNVDPDKLYYASVHACSNVLQYYPVGVQSYPIESSRIERKSAAYTGDLPHADLPPTSPTVGQVYYNPASNTVLMWNGAAWIQASATTVETGTAYPVTPAAGQFFYNLNTKNLDIWNGTAWVKANTNAEGTPAYDKVGIGTDGSYDERVRLINVLKGQLGWPAVCVELSEESFNIAIDNALDEFRRRADNAYERRHLLFTLKNDQSIYYMNDPIVGTDRIVDLIKIHRVSTIGLNVMGGDNGIYAQIFYNQFFHGAMIDLLSIHLANSMAKEFERIFAGNLTYDWHESSRQLHILRKIYKDEKVVIECVMERTEQELLVDRWAKQWLQAWAHAELKEMLGMIRSKYASGLPGAGGGLSLNGDSLLAEARQDFEECLRQMNDYEAGNGGLEFGNCAFLIG